MGTVIYMPLLGEGTDCWRPVQAVQVTQDIFEVVDHIPEDEAWAFAPGSRVRCRNHVFGGGDAGLIAFEYAIESNRYYQLLKQHEQEVFRVVFVDGEAAVVRVLHVDPTHEDFVYDLVSSNFDRDHYRERSDKSHVARFDDLVSAELQE